MVSNKFLSKKYGVYLVEATPMQVSDAPHYALEGRTSIGLGKWEMGNMNLNKKLQTLH